jgi:hypothetical protein
MRSTPRCYKQDKSRDSCNLHKTLIRSVMTYACPTWELVTNTYLLKLQRLQNKVLHTIGNFPRCTLVCDLYTSFNLLYVYDYIRKLCRKQAEVVQNRENEHVHITRHGEARHSKYKRFKLGGGQGYNHSSD